MDHPISYHHLLPAFCIKKDTLTDVLYLPVLRLDRLRPDVVLLVLVLRFRLLCYAVKFVQALLPVLLLLLFFIHAITSWIVCGEKNFLCMRKASRWNAY